MVKGLYSENFNSLKKMLENGVHRSVKLLLSKMTIIPKAIYKLNAMSFKIQTPFFSIKIKTS